MSIVPREVVQQWNDDWYAMQALRPSFRDYIANRAAEWALRRAASECDELEYFRAAEVIRAIIKGGESDGQG